MPSVGFNASVSFSEVPSELSQVQFYLTESVFSGIASCFRQTAGWTSSTRNSVCTLEQYKHVTHKHSTPRLFTLHPPTVAARHGPPLHTFSLGLCIRRSPHLLDDVLLDKRLSSEM